MLVSTVNRSRKLPAAHADPPSPLPTVIYLPPRPPELPCSVKPMYYYFSSPDQHPPDPLLTPSPPVHVQSSRPCDQAVQAWQRPACALGAEREGTHSTRRASRRGRGLVLTYRKRRRFFRCENHRAGDA